MSLRHYRCREKKNWRFLRKMSDSRSDEADTYASTTASPPPVQISLDDSMESEYKDSHYYNGGGLITPGTDFSEQVRARCPT
jgi:hypothetical protein